MLTPSEYEWAQNEYGVSGWYEYAIEMLGEKADEQKWVEDQYGEMPDVDDRDGLREQLIAERLGLMSDETSSQERALYGEKLFWPLVHKHLHKKGHREGRAFIKANFEGLDEEFDDVYDRNCVRGQLLAEALGFAEPC